VHREDSLPRVMRWVNQIHGSAPRHCCCAGWLSITEPEKIRPIAGNDRPILISPRGSAVEALSVCGKGLQRTAWEPSADVGCEVHSMSDVLRDVQCRISALAIVANF
jgi:hypothetical protein